ncbi:carcinoembryonic antigen-related cell adhesion molecule 6-like isoform X3 [Ornithorhynchus anatinus]|uniref:carcinoembryonic antigen-related cell adhesion molecule 6-like isoform X3 n=1 Tax=Ornithorhynchus anatinus TaxID=9258 RepID=UPI0010A889A9|nr:carcinoembryonic antigen-related cell adhesion molecule 6-like isoform X3 [Ornithorhynchus anatinus]
MAFPAGGRDPPRQAPLTWPGLLLAASILTVGVRPAVSLTVRPAVAVAGDNVTLTARGNPDQVGIYRWYRGTSVKENLIFEYQTASGNQMFGAAYTGRESTRSNGSLLITDVTVNHTGSYYVDMVLKDFTSSSDEGELQVYELLTEPSLTGNRTNITEGEGSVAFTCDTPATNILWIFNNKNLTIGNGMLLQGMKSLTILNAIRKDAGEYQCEVWNPVSRNRSNTVTLTVNYGPDHMAITRDSESSPTNPIVVKHNSSVTLKCQAESHPAPQYEWFLNDTINLRTSGSSHVIHNMSQEKEGTYTCKAQNNVTNISNSTSVLVKLLDPNSPDNGGGSQLSPGAIAGIVIGVLAGVALIGGLVYFLFFRNTGGKSDQFDHTEPWSSANNNNHGYPDATANKVEEVPYATVKFNANAVLIPPSEPLASQTTEIIYSEIKK